MSEEKKHPYQISPKRKRLLIIIGAVFLACLVLFILYWLFWGQFHDYTDDAYVGGNLVRVMPRVSGTVTQINTDDTAFVKQGDPLVLLDDSDAKIALAHAAANLALTVRQVRQYYDNATLAQANVAVQQTNFERARYDLNRRKQFTKNFVITSEELEHYSLALQAAQSQLLAAQAQYASAMALVEHTSLYHHPDVLNAKSNFETAFLNLKRTTILAPATGYIAKRSVQVGQQIEPGTPLMAIIPLNDLWVDANYKESQLERIRIGQSVSMVSDAYGGTTFHGKVVGLTPGTGSAFDLLPPQNATGNWIKIVQRLPVRISLDPEELKKYPLFIGLSMSVTVNTFGLKGKTLSEKINRNAVYETDVYANELANADKEVDKIIRANAPDISTPASSTVPNNL